MVAPIIAKVGLPVLVQLLSETLSGFSNPVAKAAQKALQDFGIEVASGAITPEQLAAASAHIEKMAALESDERKAGLAEINTSLRAEIGSEDKFVRRMRPTFGYLMAFTWAAQMFGLAYVIVFQTEKAHVVLNAMESLGTIWAVGLSVLGIYVYKRSGEKKGSDGIDPILWRGPRLK